MSLGTHGRPKLWNVNWYKLCSNHFCVAFCTRSVIWLLTSDCSCHADIIHALPQVQCIHLCSRTAHPSSSRVSWVISWKGPFLERTTALHVYRAYECAWYTSGSIRWHQQSRSYNRLLSMWLHASRARRTETVRCSVSVCIMLDAWVLRCDAQVAHHLCKITSL